MFKPGIQRTGGRAPNPRPSQVDVETLPVLTRMGSAPTAVEGLVARQLAEFRSEHPAMASFTG